MVKEYKELYITDEPALAVLARAEGKYVVLALPMQEMTSETKQESGHSIQFRLEDFPYALEDVEQVQTEYLELLLCRFKGIPCEILTTKRCRVREITLGDVDLLYEIYAKPSITCYMENLYPKREDELAYTRDYIKYQYGFYGFGMWIVEELQTGRVIGRAGFDMRQGSDIPELGYMIREEDQRQGYAYEVCSAILSYGRNSLTFTQVGAFSAEENEASCRLLKKLGFHLVESKGKYWYFLLSYDSAQ